MTKKKHHDKQDQPRPDAPQSPPESAETPSEAVDALEATTAERDDLLGRLQRLSAEYLNYQKRIQKEIAEACEFANTGLIKDLLGVLDDMERAMEAARENHAPDDALLDGMRLVYDKALEVLGRYGLKRIEAEGRPFDPTRHEAMFQQPSAEHEPATVLRELQRGYELKGRVIRPVRVVVSAPTETPEPGSEQAEGDGGEESE